MRPQPRTDVVGIEPDTELPSQETDSTGSEDGLTVGSTCLRDLHAIVASQDENQHGSKPNDTDHASPSSSASAEGNTPTATAAAAEPPPTASTTLKVPAPDPVPATTPARGPTRLEAYILRHTVTFRPNREATAMELLRARRTRAVRKGEHRWLEDPLGDWVPVTKAEHAFKRVQEAREHLRATAAAKARRKQVEERRLGLEKTVPCLRCAVMRMPCSLGLPGHESDEKCLRCARAGADVAFCLRQTVDVSSAAVDWWIGCPFVPGFVDEEDPVPVVYIRRDKFALDDASGLTCEDVEQMAKVLLGLDPSAVTAPAVHGGERLAQAEVKKWTMPIWHIYREGEDHGASSYTPHEWQEHLERQKREQVVAALKRRRAKLREKNRLKAVSPEENKERGYITV